MSYRHVSKYASKAAKENGNPVAVKVMPLKTAHQQKKIQICINCKRMLKPCRDHLNVWHIMLH